jgi:clostripain
MPVVAALRVRRVWITDQHSTAGRALSRVGITRTVTPVDLVDLCRRLGSCDRLSPEVRTAAKRVHDATERFMLASFGMSAYPGFESGRHGVFVVLPADTADIWKKFRWYTPLAGTGKDYGRWAFLRDAATPGNGTVENWFELLDTWFDTNDETGGLNNYKP